MNLGIIGVGLIGGSIALDLKKSGLASRVLGADQLEETGEEAVRLGLIDECVTVDRLAVESDLIVAAIPVGALVQLLPDVLNRISPTCVVFDVGSTKKQICDALDQHPGRERFVAAHPLAGTENSGPRAAFTGLFAGKTNIICERSRSAADALARVENVFSVLGMKTVYMDADEHDRHVAYVSHLSHVSSFLLGQTVLDIEKDERNIFELASTGFSSTVRLAKSSPDMWAPIFEQNARYLSQALLEYIMHLQKFHYHLVKGDVKELHQMLSSANEIRRVLDGIELKTKQQKEKTVILNRV
ncbi:MAG: prephenate dehydrogenase [Cyclobacteriaceae bacterium]|jgi:prephenate dehydrogenase|nr:prephenate dehydrogenase [Flammeovirgaceae bacterium]